MIETPQHLASSRLHLGRMLAAPEQFLQAQEPIESFLEGLNRNSPAARRSIRSWAGEEQSAVLRIATVARVDPTALGESYFLAEVDSSFALDVQTCSPAMAPAALSVCLPLSGAVRMRTAAGEFLAEAGQGLIIDPAEVELTQVMAGTHFFEFNLRKSQLMRLGAELNPGGQGAAPRFDTQVTPDLARRLLFMSQQAAASLLPPTNSIAEGPRHPALIRRWTELIALTLLDEQPLASTRRPCDALDLGKPTPASLRRALGFIEANAQQDIGLAEIADVACLSVSSLLRLFKRQLDQTPGAYLRQLRLDRARAELRRGDCASVRQLAQRWGFQNASKFARAYRERFGESPSQER